MHSVKIHKKKRIIVQSVVTCLKDQKQRENNKNMKFLHDVRVQKRGIISAPLMKCTTGR